MPDLTGPGIELQSSRGESGVFEVLPLHQQRGVMFAIQVTIHTEIMRQNVFQRHFTPALFVVCGLDEVMA